MNLNIILFFLQKIIAYRNYVRNIVKLVFGNGTSSFAVAYLRLTVNEVLDFEQRLNQVHVQFIHFPFQIQCIKRMSFYLSPPVNYI